jgi:hypothetical protein
MAISLGFGQGNKDTPFSGSTGGGSIQPKLQLNGQGQAVTNGSGGFLNYLQGLMQQPAVAPANQAPLTSPETGGAAGQPAASTAGPAAQGKSPAAGAMTSAALGGGI